MKRMITRSKSLSILFTSFTLLVITLATGLHDVKAEQGPLMRPQTWVDGKLFDGVVTLTDFKPLADAFDEYHALFPEDITREPYVDFEGLNEQILPWIQNADDRPYFLYITYLPCIAGIN
ncbi:MAG: hypothetical protein IH820_16465 [Bacteroidetes bacterium]|nr:hypothetical protein [Bacteroidota bacterium]